MSDPPSYFQRISTVGFHNPLILLDAVNSESREKFMEKCSVLSRRTAGLRQNFVVVHPWLPPAYAQIASKCAPGVSFQHSPLLGSTFPFVGIDPDRV